MDDAHTLVRRYYGLLNEHQFDATAELFAPDAVLQHRPDGNPLSGPAGFLESARATIAIFPDIQLQILHIEDRGDTILELDVSATGTHKGDWNMGALGILRATGKPLTLRLRELLEIRDGMITFSSITYDLQDVFGRSDTPL